MPTQITMPKLSDTMEEGTILRWFKAVGDRVEPGEVVAEVETDKADMELEAEASGVVQEIRVKQGDSAAVGAVLAILGNAGDAGSEKPPAQAASKPAATNAAPPAVKPTAAQNAPTSPPRVRPAAPAAAVAAPSKPSALSTTDKSAPPPSSAKWKPRTTQAPAVASGRQEVSKLRQTVAKQMTASKRDTPHFYVTCEIDMSEAARLRTTLAESGIVAERITFTHLLIRALTLTLGKHPRVNASWDDGAILVHDDINIGIAVALDDGLVAPVLHRCQDLSLAQIAQAAQELVTKAQSGRFSGADMTGATFSISNMGMLDIDEFSAVITPPQAAILAVGTIKDRPIARDGQIVVAKTMRVTLSVDHRVLNGVEAGRFLEDLKHVLERPALLLLHPG
ncbi:MAG TPA: dihydrolipoamide acetyltransferase family protein [Candidatus Acidoferrales bacterium]|nr:dihydrolipoamide acetyltransferase family protein [Candidatus Acidoferrales bacterium]